MKAAVLPKKDQKTMSRGAECAVLCPACGSRTIEIRYARRCPRCQWVICESCDGENASPEENDSLD